MDIIASKKDFECLFLIHSANVDYNFHDKERQLIINKYGEDNFRRLLETYHENKSHIFSLLVNSYKIHIYNEDEKEKLRSLIMNLFLKDGKICQFENGFIEVFDLIDDD